MKKLFYAVVVLLILLILPAPAISAPFLACDIPTNAWKGVEIEVNGLNVVDGIMQVSEDGTKLLIYDLASQPNGSVEYRARFLDAPNWPGPGGWSNFLDVNRPSEVPQDLSVMER